MKTKDRCIKQEHSKRTLKNKTATAHNTMVQWGNPNSVDELRKTAKHQKITCPE